MVNSAYSTFANPASYEAYAKSLGTGGSNPLRPLIRRAQVGAGDRLLQQVAFGNSLEPGRQAAINRAIFMAQPGREESMIARNTQAARGARATYNRDMSLEDRAMGGSGIVADQPLNALDPFSASALGYRRHVYSPEYQNAQSQMLLSLFGEGQNLDLLDRLTQGSGMTQQSNLMRQPSNDLGAQLFGTIGQLAGSGVFNNLFRRGGGQQLMSGGGLMGGGYM